MTTLYKTGGDILKVGGDIAAHVDCCCVVPDGCLNCDETTKTVKVVIAGMANGTCDECDGLNGTLFLAYLSSSGTGSPSWTCHFIYELGGLCVVLGGHYIENVQADFTYTPPGTDSTLVRVTVTGTGGTQATFEKTIAGRVSCTLTDEDIPLVASGGTRCDWSGISCTLSIE